ncbi:hypothetical protein GCM10008905_12990 [Clostridium malenominatum]|uniref:Uncharacterized protein n=1 Tax=Clostridium malenominatum TaxID=1539 RepID=A0ABN1IV59_9CLOT
MVLKNIISKASLPPITRSAKREMEFASPSLMPGTPGSNTGSCASIIYIIKAMLTNILKKTNFFIFFIKSPIKLYFNKL